jgi:hypothetical protein
MISPLIPFANQLTGWDETIRNPQRKGSEPGQATSTWGWISALFSRYNQKASEVDHAKHPKRPGGLYNAMISPLIPYAIRGVLWYQGEENVRRAYQYRTLFPLLIRNWRDAWGQGRFPFYFVQLANFGATSEEPSESIWAELREAQSMTLALPNTGQAVAIDIGNANDIHPMNKQDVGRRLARIALTNTL